MPYVLNPWPLSLCQQHTKGRIRAAHATPLYTLWGCRFSSGAHIEGGDVMDFVDRHSMGVRAWVGGVQAADICQEEQVACSHQASYLHTSRLSIIPA